MKKQQEKAGFTIIEVVLVLAIAGLIFLMVFVGFPALQRSQRDTQRRNDMARLITQFSSYQTNNNGSVPAGTNEWARFMKDYMKRKVIGETTNTDPESEFKNPLTGLNYAYNVYSCKDINDNERCPNPTDKQNTYKGTIIINKNAFCDGETQKRRTGTNNIAASIGLEGGGVYCVDNS